MRALPIALRPAAVRRTYRGGANIQRWHGIADAVDSDRPEEWVCSVTEAVGSPRIPGEGLSFLADDPDVALRDVIAADPTGMLGAAHQQKYGSELALLVKLIDSAERLSIQVHPDKAFARQHLGSQFGKTEAWYILDAQPVGGEAPYLLFGFKAGVTRETWSELFWRQDIAGMIDCLNKVTPLPGQVFLIEAGTPHAIGPGCFLIEAQEPTDFTFRAEWTMKDGTRIDDRLIHYGVGFDKVIDCFGYGSDAAARVARNMCIEPRVVREGVAGTETTLLDEVNTDCFAMRELRVATALDCDARSQFSSMIILSGQGNIDFDGGSVAARAGDQFFLPPGLEFALVNDPATPELRVIRCFPPKA